MKAWVRRYWWWGGTTSLIIVAVGLLGWTWMPSQPTMDENQALRENEKWAANITAVFQGAQGFEGYERRTHGNLPCESGSFGQRTDLTVADVTYHFSQSGSQDPQLRSELRAKLAELFADNGFTIIRDDEFGDGSDFSLVGQRESDEFQVALKAKWLGDPDRLLSLRHSI